MTFNNKMYVAYSRLQMTTSILRIPRENAWLSKHPFNTSKLSTFHMKIIEN